MSSNSLNSASEVQNYKEINTSWDAQIQRYGDTSIYIFRDGEIHHGMHKYRDTGIQIYIYMYSEMERYGDTNIYIYSEMDRY